MLKKVNVKKNEKLKNKKCLPLTAYLKYSIVSLSYSKDEWNRIVIISVILSSLRQNLLYEENRQKRLKKV